MVPAVGAYRPTMVLPTVVLPQPVSPTSPNVSPRPTSNETSSTAFRLAMCRANGPPTLIAKYFLRCSTLSMVSIVIPPLQIQELPARSDDGENTERGVLLRLRRVAVPAHGRCSWRTCSVERICSQQEAPAGPEDSLR